MSRGVVSWMSMAARWIRNERSRRAPRELKVAGVMATRDYNDACSAFGTLSALSDVTIVLDDNSSVPFPFRDRCTEYVAVQGPALWNATANLTTLMYRAFVHGCEWVLSMDDDLLLSHALRSKADVASLIRKTQVEKADVYHLPLKDLWESESQVRVDGVWGRKTFGLLRRNWFFDEAITLRDPSLRLHSPAYPVDRRLNVLIDRAHAVYHTGCLTADARRARVEKYRREDPDNRFQRDYSYMIDDSGLVLDRVPDADLAAMETAFKRPLFRPRG